MIRYGIVGAGRIARKFAEDIKLAEDSILVSVASRTIEKAEAFAKKYDIQNAYGTYLELAESGSVDAVYIATPHSFHKEQSIMFMNHKIHVLCEKPIAVNASQFEEMVTVAKANDVLLMEAMWTRFLPSTKYVKNIIDSKEYGNVTFMDFEFGYEIDENYPNDMRLLNPDLAGGSILDLGSYPVSIMKHFSKKEIRSVEVEAMLHENGIDLDASIYIDFVDDTKATLRSSLSQDLDDLGVIRFENGSIKMKHFYKCTQLKVNKNKVSTPCLGRGFVHQIEAFTETLSNGLRENDIMSHNESREVMELLDLIREKAGVVYPFE